MNAFKKITLQDIATELNMTAATVSRALNNHSAISEPTRQAVFNAAKRLNYHPNNIASSLRLGKSRIIGVIIPSAEINFFGSVVHGIERIANENNYNILLFQSNELFSSEKKGLETFIRSRVDGVLASIAKETTNMDHYADLQKRGVPLVIFDRVNDELTVPSVVINDHKGAYLATKHLIEQGCRRIAHIGGQRHVQIFQHRLNGYLDALKQHGLEADEDLIMHGDVTIDSGRECMNALLGAAPDAVFAVEDFTALGAIQALKAAGKEIPRDVAVIGFANEAFGEYITPSLSTVDQQTIHMGEEAARIFFAGDHRKFYDLPPKHLVLDPVLKYRESSLKRTP